MVDSKAIGHLSIPSEYVRAIQCMFLVLKYWILLTQVKGGSQYTQPLMQHQQGSP